MTLLRGEARAGAAATGRAASTRCAPCSPGWAGRPSPRRPGAGARPVGVAAGAGLPGTAQDFGDGDARAPTLAGFVAELDRRAAEQHAPVADGVTLATLHAAKGLEWDAVFLVRHAGGHDADQLRRHPRAVEEERRLLYVGVTRARRHLWVSWALARNPGGAGPRRLALPRRAATRVGHRPARRGRPWHAHPKQEGRRAAAVPAAAGQLARAQASAAARTARCPTTRSCSSGCGPGARSRPRSRAVPAFVVFTDATLRGDRRGQADRPARRCSRSTASARPSSTSTATTLLALLG